MREQRTQSILVEASSVIRERRIKHCFTLVGFVALFSIVLAGCARQATPTEAPAPPPTEEGLGLADTLYVFNWADYIDESLITDYEEEFGVTVVYDTFDSNEDLLAKLQAGATGYDVIFPSDYMVAQMIELEMADVVDPPPDSWS